MRWISGRTRLIAAMGIAGGLGAGRLLESRLHGLASSDPWSLVLATTMLVAVALASSFVPVWRAARLDPAVALREE